MKTPAPIIADDIRLQADRAGAVLSCRITAPGMGLPPTLWYRLPPEVAPFVSVNGDPFLPPLLMVAMRTGRRLVIEGDCSAKLLGSSRQVMSVFAKWAAQRGDTMETVEVAATPVTRDRRGTASGAFFSGGVDSLYTLLRNLETFPEGHPQRISHLILVHGFDIKLEQTELFETVRANAARAAEALGRALIAVRTNVRETLRGVSWLDYGYGPAVCGVGLAHGGILSTIYLGSSSTGEPEASHPEVDPLWSTEGLRFVHDASEVPRLTKVRLIATTPVALEVLRVCWENPDSAYNCGRCEKCLRTMVGLALCGGLGRAPHFPPDLDLQEIGRLAIQPSSRGFWEEMLAEARSAGRDAMAEAIEGALARGAWAETPLGRLDRRWWALAARFGLTPSRVKAMDAALLGGGAARGLHWLQGRARGRGGK